MQAIHPVAVAYEPVLQSEHQVHGPQTDEPGADCVDGPHEKHAVAPIDPTKVLEEHNVHTAAPELLENDPAPQKKHVGE